MTYSSLDPYERCEAFQTFEDHLEEQSRPSRDEPPIVPARSTAPAAQPGLRKENPRSGPARTFRGDELRAQAALRPRSGQVDVQPGGGR